MEREPLRVWAGTLPEVDLQDRAERLALNPIVRAHRDRRLEPDARAARYGSLLTGYRFVGPTEAEVALLPRAVDRVARRELEAFVDGAERYGLRTLVFARHDLEPIMPSASIVLLHPGPTRGAQPHADVLALPYLLTDRSGGVEPRPSGDRPTVAFCGQGATRPVVGLLHAASRLARVAGNRVRPRVVPPPVRGHVALRAEALRRLHDHPGVEDHFVVRDRYRAGVVSDEDRARTQAEFDDNLRSSAYALCVRGTGNFSARFYEALSFGRIPVFVDTDCVLPFEDEIDWRRRCVWVERGELPAIGDRVVADHRAADPDGLRTAESLRVFWEEHLSEDGYFRHLVDAVRRLT